jgi:hypothetical protein
MATLNAISFHPRSSLLDGFVQSHLLGSVFICSRDACFSAASLLWFDPLYRARTTVASDIPSDRPGNDRLRFLALNTNWLFDERTKVADKRFTVWSW